MDVRNDTHMLGRRRLLRTGAFASILPLGFAGSRVFASPARPFPADFPLCHGSGDYIKAADHVAPPDPNAKSDGELRREFLEQQKHPQYRARA